MAVTATNTGNRTNKKLTFKNKAQFRSCTLKTNNTFKDNNKTTASKSFQYSRKIIGNTRNNISRFDTKVAVEARPLDHVVKNL